MRPRGVEDAAPYKPPLSKGGGRAPGEAGGIPAASRRAPLIRGGIPALPYQ